MKLSAFTDVCLRTIMVLATPGTGQLTSREISDSVGVPYNHVAKAVLELRTLGILQVTRGRNGGAALGDNALHTSLGGLLRQLDKRTDIVDCSEHDAQTACPLSGNCRLRAVFRQAREAFYASLDPLTIQDICPGSSASPITSLPFPMVRDFS
ncbi:MULTISPECIES: RrF2 family transcriptional regulator [Glutamicibacter]|jgi:Rrf2 family nitric oxide-sensitive transcriptional repressor|uniref:Rrf2 family transcriptional regulator n=1 Tax=Glutamicibacter halophytocola TaxID=1933880 RepID=A0A5B8IM10_9MICC|nr:MULTISPECIES: Rrf2 family transcriptional regulator [Glutamicibacter]ALG28006.1 Rrf2 family transcriptional regulator [Glutamicibacter halophytocola]MBF6671845.1 Rrf2 family transcriptional regulator [Glutamicibacter sp. FBE19]NQD39628.1 Rrf2 family transcriptional regulator [Glutamicibacter halophytocola]QDY67342.1 Rrf2 family transcriptional regulator [Glutamicibacter halophytocola]UUX59523.1 Rrf2 family transcriptional regulator [Glutamicibacter halophytocola]